MSNVVIVAIPEEQDYVWKISSEKIPHVTLLYLDDSSSDHPWGDITAFVEHAAKGLHPLFLPVERRDTLGDKDADVLFFEKRWGVQLLVDFRSQLLQYAPLRAAYDAIEQKYPPEWTPHLTLGYPETPAHEDTREVPGIRYVDINKIAVWTGYYEGPEFRLEHEEDEMELAMAASRGESFLKHYGVKGMKWGVRKDRASGVGDSVKKKAAKGAVEVAKTYNKARPKSTDAAEAIRIRRQRHTKGINSLSNQELQALVQRMNLEQQLSTLTKQKRQSSLASAFISDQLVALGGRKVSSLNPNSPEAAAIRTAMGQLATKKSKTR